MANKLEAGEFRRAVCRMQRLRCLNAQDGISAPMDAAIFRRSTMRRQSGVLVRAQEMAWYVDYGALDAGLTGNDWALENQTDVECVTSLTYSKVIYRRCAGCCACLRIVAVPEAGGPGWQDHCD